MVGRVRRKKKSGLSIKIKPFTKPPSLPKDFYTSSTNLLWSSLRSILLRSSSSKTTTPELSNVPSREELYTTVQNLCTHGFGPKLYEELISVLEESAFICVQRLLETSDAALQASVPNPAASSYATRNCQSENGQIFFTSMVEEVSASEGGTFSLILTNVWKMYSDYAQFLNCVRNVFMALDRMFIYLPPPAGAGAGTGEEGRVISRNATSGSVAKAAGEVNGGDSGASALFAMGVDAWDMWDVGIHCLWKHLALKEKIHSVAVAQSMGDTSTMASMDFSTTTSTGATASTSAKSEGKHSIIDTLKIRTIQCILAELDLLQSRSPLSQQSPQDSDMGGNVDMMHKSLLRNCVSVFRTLAFVSKNGRENNINKEFLDDLVTEMTRYFIHESQQWMSEADTSAAAPSKTSYDACSLLHHIDKRTKQVSGMTSYYHLADDSSGHSSDKSKTTSSSSSSKGPNNILTHLVEKYVLTPHFTPQLILHPTNLYPILDQEKETLNHDAKLVYKLSKRIVATSSNAIPSSSFTTAPCINSITSSPGMELLRQSFESYGIERGTAIMRTATAPGSIGNVGSKPSQPLTAREVNTKIIMNLLRYKAHLEYLQKVAFDGENFFGRTLRKVLEDILNNGAPEETQGPHGTSSNRRRNRYANNSSDGGKRVAELLAKYIDLRFKNAKSSLTSTPIKTSSAENDLEIFQTAALDLFRYIQSKDVFEAFYRQDLAKRLLLNKSSSIDAERSFMSKLKAECGTGYTTKMEGMFKDMELSKDVMSTYSDYLSANTNEGTRARSADKLDMEVQVLTTGYWPVRTLKYDIILPKSMHNKKAEFEKYYKTKYQGRRIAWQNALGNCIVRANFPKIQGPRELNVSLLQALILLCFNLDGDVGDEVRLTIVEVMKMTGISDRGEAERVLQSLSMGRIGTQVLRRLDGGKVNSESMDIDNTPRKKHKTIRKAVSDSDIFVFNADFTSNQRRIRITNIQMKETSDDRKKTHEAVTLDRLHLIDAAIVRIMKARKTLEHRALVGEVMNQLKFPARSVDLKKRIEGLIEREYLERTEGDASKYNYLA